MPLSAASSQSLCFKLGKLYIHELRGRITLTSTMQRWTQSRVTRSSSMRSSAPAASSAFASCTCFCCCSFFFESGCCLRLLCVAVLRLLVTGTRALAMLLMAMPSATLGGAAPTCFVHTATFSTTSLSNVGRMFDSVSAAAAAAAAAAALLLRFIFGEGSACERQQTSQQSESSSSISRLTIRIVEMLPCPEEGVATLPSRRPRCNNCCRKPTT